MFDLSLVETYDARKNYIGIEFQVIDGQIQFCTGIEAVRQEIRNLLLTWTDQWFLDVSYGIDYSSQIGQNKSQLIVLEIIGKVSQIEEVSKIIKCTSNIVEDIMVIELSVMVKNEVLKFKVPENV